MARQQTRADHERTLRQAAVFIERNLGDRDLCLAVVAYELHVSPRRLQRVFRSAGSTTFSECLFARRMERARELLGEGQSARQVAERVGYGSGAALAKALRRRYGETPTALRARAGP